MADILESNSVHAVCVGTSDLTSQGTRVDVRALRRIQVCAVSDEAFLRRKSCAAHHLLDQPEMAFGARPTQAGQPGNDSFRRMTEKSWNSRVHISPGMGRILAVAGKKLIATNAGKQYAYVTARLAGN